MSIDLKAPIRVKLDRLYLDPNNPRLATQAKPGYDRPGLIFDAQVQTTLESRLRQAYKGVRNLSRSILSVGWVPVDPMLVWEHPKRRGHYVVLEGNTRTAVLRTLRKDLQRERTRLARARRNEFIDADAVRDHQARVERLEAAVESTRELEVLPVAARGPADLAESLPRLLGVRHLSHAQQWKPYATNVYVHEVYRKLFEEEFGEGEPLRIDEQLLSDCAELTSLSAWKVRRALQGLMSFNHFRSRFASRLPAGEGFADEDQVYFLALLDPGHAREQFQIAEDSLRLQPELEEVLFRWAFSKPRRAEGVPNRNVLRSADDIRLWNRMGRYDEKHRTKFARQLDVQHPERARPIADLEVEYLAHKAEQTPLELVQSLVKTLKEMEVETIRAQRHEIRPAIDELITLGHDYLAMLEAIEGQP